LAIPYSLALTALSPRSSVCELGSIPALPKRYFKSSAFSVIQL